jgi:hypothetical protein
MNALVPLPVAVARLAQEKPKADKLAQVAPLSGGEKLAQVGQVSGAEKVAQVGPPQPFRRNLRRNESGAPSSCVSHAALAQRIAELLREHEANKTALRAASKRFNSPPTPSELSVTYRGLFGPIAVDVDPDWIRDLLPNFSPRSRPGRKLRRLLRIHEAHYARLWADRDASGMGAAVEAQERVSEAIRASATAALDLGGHRVADVALQAAALLAVKLGSYHEFKRAPAVISALLEVANEREDSNV